MSTPHVRRIRRPLVAALACAASLALPASASAQFGQVFGDYRGDQRINGCAYSPGQLQGALGQVPPDIEQYAPNFVDELNRALEARGRGDCSGAAAGAPAGAAADGELAAPGPGEVDPGPTPRPPKGAVAKRVREISDFKPPSLEPDRSSTPGALAATGGIIGILALIAVAALGLRMLSHRPRPALGGARLGSTFPGGYERTPEERLREQEARAARRLQERRR